MRLFRFSTLFYLSVLIGFSVAPAYAQNREPWVVQSVSGDVRHEVGGKTTALAVGDQIGIGHKVTTAEGARAVLVRGVASMTMSPGSEISIPADTGNMLTRIVQKVGTLLLKVNKRPEQHFEVTTPYLAAIVKGTTFTVSVNAEGGAVHVVEGLVQVDDALSGQTGFVRPGQTGIVTSKPGGGLKISGGKAVGGSKKAADNASKGLDKVKDKARSENAAGRGKGPGGDKADTRAAKAQNAFHESAVATVAKDRKPGLAIAKTLGPVKINISAATHGFVRADGSRGSNAGGNQGNGTGKNGLAEASDNSGNGNSGNGNGATGNVNNGNLGGGSFSNGNPGGNSGSSNAGGNSGNSNAGGNSGNSNAGGNGNGNSGNSHKGGNKG